MKGLFKMVAPATLAMLCPWAAAAQGAADQVASLQSVLDQLYADMMPLCGQLVGVGRGIAGFAALWYIAARVWRHLANAEAVDMYPLLRPFGLGLCILLFPQVIALMNGVLSPMVTGTAAMMTRSNESIAYLLEKKEAAMKETNLWQMYGDGGNYEKWYQYAHRDEDASGWWDGLTNSLEFEMSKLSYNFRYAIKQWLAEILHLLFEAVALCINTLRTFFLIVLAVVGPIVFGLSVFDGFQNTLTIWLARYVNVFLWLPVANIFGSILARIQENMLQLDIDQIEQSGDTAFSTMDTAYLIFMVIGIVGYLYVPTMTNHIVNVAGDNKLLTKVTSLGKQAVSVASNQIGAITQVADAAAIGAMRYMTGGGSSQAKHDIGGNGSGKGNYMHDKLSGKNETS